MGSESFGKPKWTIGEDDAVEKKKDIYRLRSPLKRGLLTSTIVEYYASDFYYGVYDYSGNLIQASAKESLVERIVDFFGTMSTNLSGAKAGKGREDFPAIENRKIVVTHLVRERKSYHIGGGTSGSGLKGLLPK